MDQEEAQRRITAARILRGLEQRDLDRLGHEYGLGKQELGRTERGTLPITRVRREVLARILGVPERWFTEDDVDVIVGLAPQRSAPLTDEQLRQAAELLPALLEAARALPPAPAPSAPRTGEQGPPGAAAGGGNG